MKEKIKELLARAGIIDVDNAGDFMIFECPFQGTDKWEDTNKDCPSKIPCVDCVLDEIIKIAKQS